MTILTVCAVLLGTAARAEAYTSWAFTDDFETTASQWYRDRGGRYVRCPVYRTCDPAEVVDNAAYARSGTHFAWISNTSGYPDTWVSLGRNLRLPARAESCTLSVYIRVDYAGETPATINLEAIDTAAWTYEALKTFQRTDPSYFSSYRLYTVSWVPGTRDITVRIVAVGQNWVLRIFADDVDIHCRVA